jgi:hypothetical protein
MLDQLVAHLSVKVGRERLPLIVRQREEDLDEMHARATLQLRQGSSHRPSGEG